MNKNQPFAVFLVFFWLKIPNNFWICFQKKKKFDYEKLFRKRKAPQGAQDHEDEKKVHNDFAPKIMIITGRMTLLTYLIKFSSLLRSWRVMTFQGILVLPEIVLANSSWGNIGLLTCNGNLEDIAIKRENNRLFEVKIWVFFPKSVTVGFFLKWLFSEIFRFPKACIGSLLRKHGFEDRSTEEQNQYIGDACGCFLCPIKELICLSELGDKNFQALLKNQMEGSLQYKLLYLPYWGQTKANTSKYSSIQSISKC